MRNIFKKVVVVAICLAVGSVFVACDKGNEGNGDDNGGGGGNETQGTLLGAEEAFEFKYLISGQSDNENPPASVGIRWESIGQRGLLKTAKFVPVPSTERFVKLTKSEFDAIKTKEALKKAHEDGSKEPSFEWTRDDIEDGQYFITKNGTTYSLAQMTSLTFDMGWSYAVIKYRQ